LNNIFLKQDLKKDILTANTLVEKTHSTSVLEYIWNRF